MKILSPFQPTIKGGGIITAMAEIPGQALYWELKGLDPDTGAEGSPYGSLRWDHSRADQAGLSCNIYLAPTDPALAGRTDRLKVSHA